MRGTAAAPNGTDVLVVEDDADCRDILKDILVHAGHQVSAAVDRREALELIEQGRRPTVIIMDLMMPDIDMKTFEKRLKELGLDDIPVVAVSAARERELPTPKSASVRFLKPIDLTELLDSVTSLQKKKGRRRSS